MKFVKPILNMQDTRFKKARVLWMGTLFLAIIGVAGCNVTGGIDSPDDRDSIVEFAKAKIDTGKTTECDEAYSRLNQLGGQRDTEVRQLMGWAKLCLAGVTMSKVGATLFSFNSSSANPYFIVGDLANAIIPQTTETLTQIGEAITQFGLMGNTDEQKLSTSLGQLIKAAALIAKASGDTVKVKRLDVAGVNCSGVSNCVTGSAVCTAQNLANADADSVANAIQNAATLISSASFGNVGSLVTNLNTLFNGAGSNLSRCYIVNQMLRE